MYRIYGNYHNSNGYKASFQSRLGKNYKTIRRALQALAAFKANNENWSWRFWWNGNPIDAGFCDIHIEHFAA